MGFIESINRYFIKWSDFKSRSSRSEYWWATLFVSIGSPVSVILITFTITELILNAESTGIAVEILVGFTTFFLHIFIFIASAALSVRRLHDVNKSGWWYLIIITVIGIIPLLIWACTEGTEGVNRYGKATGQRTNNYEENHQGEKLSDLRSDQITFSLVRDELAEGIKQEDLWEMAQEQSSGDATLIKLVYINLRINQLTEEASKHVDTIMKARRQIKLAAEIELNKKAAFERARLEKENRDELIEKENQAIKYLHGRGFSIKKKPKGKKEFYWRVEKDGFFRHEAKSVHELYAYAEKIGL